MNLSFSKEDLDFKQEVTDFLDANYPGDIKERQDKRLPLDKEQNIRWQKILSKKGWFAVNWPSEYSGSPELSLTQKYILQNVLAIFLYSITILPIILYSLCFSTPLFYTLFILTRFSLFFIY